jgi:hypothetical protein
MAELTYIQILFNLAEDLSDEVHIDRLLYDIIRKSVWHWYDRAEFVSTELRLVLLFFARDVAIAIFGSCFELNIGLRLLNNHCMN